MQSQMLHFIWAGGRARCPPWTQWKHKSVGEMGIPILKDYYVATILDQLKNWFESAILKPWCQLEFAWMHPKSLLSLLVATDLLPKGIDIDHPTIQATIQAWSYLRMTGDDTLSSIDILTPLESLKWVIPNISLDQWISKDILNLKLKGVTMIYNILHSKITFVKPTPLIK